MSIIMAMDCETSGLNPKTNRIIELGIRFYQQFQDPNDKPEEGDAYTWVSSEWIHHPIEVTALKTNKRRLTSVFSKENPVEEREMIHSFVDVVLDKKPDYILGYNVNFDLEFIKRTMERHGLNYDGFLPHKIIDPYVIANAMVLSCYLPTMKYMNLKSVCDEFKVDTKASGKMLHSVEADIDCVYRLWDQMSKTSVLSKK